MKVSLRHLFFNRYLLIAGVLVVVIPFLSWAIHSQYYEAAFFWDLSQLRWTREEYFKEMFPFHMYPIEGFSIMQLILPVMTGLVMIPFLRIKRTFPLLYVRTASYASFLVRTILKYLLVGCMTLYLFYLVFLCIGASFLPFKDDPQIPYLLFPEIFGENFIGENTFLFFMVEGFVRYFIFGFVYGLFAAAVSFLTKRDYVSLLAPIVYYVGFDILSAVLNPVLDFDAFFLSPAYTLVWNTRAYVNSFLLFVPLLPPFLFSVGVIARDLFQKRKRGDAYAVA